jgi:hypothetical protein
LGVSGRIAYHIAEIILALTFNNQNAELFTVPDALPAAKRELKVAIASFAWENWPAPRKLSA